MKKGKRIKPRFPIEYRVLITPKYKEHEKTIVTRVALRTVNEFSNFRYEIVVVPELQDRSLRLNIHGLRAPQVSLPGAGPAVYETEYADLRGPYEIVISKLDREENSFGVTISDRQVTLERAPKKKFVEVVTDENEW